MLAGYDHLLRAAERSRWDESEVDLSADARAWPRLVRYNREPLRRLLAGFCVAERAVAEHLEPFEQNAEDPALAACFAAQAEDERRHARFFARVAREVMGMDPYAEARELAADGLVELFERRLPAMSRELAKGNRSLREAVTLYHLVLEGVVFHVGQAVALDLLDTAGTLPAVREGVARVQADERWHVGLGVRCLQDSGLDPARMDLALLDAKAAAHAWGTDAITSDRTTQVIEQHRRRLGQARRPAPVAA
ncbi:MAG: ribonucleotide-diphosphate reductase subunit beta [Thermoleophilaceae bacterium]